MQRPMSAAQAVSFWSCCVVTMVTCWAIFQPRSGPGALLVGLSGPVAGLAVLALWRAWPKPQLTESAAKPLALTCSFCCKNSHQVKKLIAGPNVYICDECVGLCNAILADGAEEPQSWKPSLPD
jgi:hypothetical protein